LFHGIELGSAATPVALGRPPHHFSDFSLSLSLFLLPLGMTVIYFLIYIYIFIRMWENLCCYTPEPPCPQLQQVGALGLRLDTQSLPDLGRPPWTIMTMFCSGKGIVLLPSGPSSISSPQVWDLEVMKLLIMPQSLSL
jgi:hypothetical protein